MPMMVEMCVGSIADIQAAISAGANRVELCAGLELGGLTPSAGLLEAALSCCPLPIIIMVRPRAGGFCYDRYEFAIMLRDAERMVSMGAAGIAFGVLTKDGRVDASRTRELTHAAGQATAVFHRAFDFVVDQRAALETLANAGVSRVLSSGGRASAIEGAAVLRRLIEQANAHIQILPAGGINARNVRELVAATGCDQVHIGSATCAFDGTVRPQSIELCDFKSLMGGGHRAVAQDSAREVVQTLRAGESAIAENS